MNSDAKVLSDFITRYINVNNRQSSPKYVYGVSYGGMRAPIIGLLLLQSSTRDYVADPSNKVAKVLTGLVLNSPILDYKTDCYFPYNVPVSCGGAAPTYAMVGAVHEKSLLTAGQTLSDYVNKARSFADTFNGLYADVFGNVSNKTPDTQKQETFLKSLENKGIINTLYQYTGVGKPFRGDGSDSAKDNPWIEYPNMNPVQFTEKFDPAKGKLMLADGRVFLSREQTDPALDQSSIYSKFTWLYQYEFIGYQAYAYYLDLNGTIIGNWNFQRDASLAGITPDLATALALDSSLKVLIQHGYYDLNTPFYQSELNIKNAGLAAQIPVKVYETGHGILPDTTIAYQQVMKDLGAFYDQSSIKMTAALNSPVLEGKSP